MKIYFSQCTFSLLFAALFDRTFLALWFKAAAVEEPTKWGDGGRRGNGLRAYEKWCIPGAECARRSAGGVGGTWHRFSCRVPPPWDGISECLCVACHTFFVRLLIEKCCLHKGAWVAWEVGGSGAVWTVGVEGGTGKWKRMPGTHHQNLSKSYTDDDPTKKPSPPPKKKPNPLPPLPFCHSMAPPPTPLCAEKKIHVLEIIIYSLSLVRLHGGF